MTSALLRRALCVAGATLASITCSAILFVASPGAAAGVIKADIVLSPERRTVQKTVRSLLTNDLTLQVDDTLAPNPAECRTGAIATVLCDAFRIRVVRDTRPGATNLVQFFIHWDKVFTVPDLGLEIAATSDQDVPDLDAFVFTRPSGTALPFKQVGGRTTTTPERIFWEATQDTYDLVIRSQLGVVSGYTMVGKLYDDLLDPPRELLEELTPAPVAALRAPATEVLPSTRPAPVVTPSLDLVVAAPDRQIAAIGLGATEQFDAAAGIPRTRATAATEPPSTLALILAMVAIPAAVFGAITLFFVRRRHATFAA